nr:MAG TPA: hypothetical protein [Crassvirales sp.]
MKKVPLSDTFSHLKVYICTTFWYIFHPIKIMMI